MQPTFLHLAAGAAAADPVSTRDLSSWPSLCRNGSQQSASRRLTSSRHRGVLPFIKGCSDDRVIGPHPFQRV